VINQQGAISYLKQRSSNFEYNWADSTHQLGLFLYQSFIYPDFYNFNIVYTNRCPVDYCGDFSKLGMNITQNFKGDWLATVSDIFEKQLPEGLQILVTLRLNSILSDVYGAPRLVYINYLLMNSQPQIQINLQWFQKVATRLPEAMWLKFTPIVSSPQLWQMDVMGSLVSPYEVVANGSRHLHSIWEGVYYDDTTTPIALSITSLDANLVAPGDTNHLLNFDGGRLPDLEGGMHFNIFNNLWGTAFNQWYDDNAQFRFTLDFQIE